MYLRRESARMPASTFQAYPVYPGDCREIKGPVLLPRLFLWPGKDDVPRLHGGSNNRRTLDSISANNELVDKYW